MKRYKKEFEMTDQERFALAEIGNTLGALPLANFSGNLYGRDTMFIQAVHNLIKNRKEDWAKQERTRLEKARLAANKRAKERQPKILAWVKANLKPGMRVWVKGARDGIGFREIREVFSSNFVADQLQPNDHWTIARKDHTKVKWSKVNQITTHYLDKVVAVEIKGKRISVLELIK